MASSHNPRNKIMPNIKRQNTYSYIKEWHATHSQDTKHLPARLFG